MDIPQWIRDLPPVSVALVSAGIAVFSLLISAISLFIHWRIYRRDNHDVLVELQWNAESIHVGGMHSAIKQRFAHIRVTNKGRRPVNIVYIGLELPGRAAGSANWLKKSVKLDEGDPSITIDVAQDSSLDPFLSQWKKIRAVATTNAGRRYRSKAGYQPPIIVPGQNLESMEHLQDFTRYPR